MTNPRRSRAALKGLSRFGTDTVDSGDLSRQARQAARERGPADLKAAARKAARTRKNSR